MPAADDDKDDSGTESGDQQRRVLVDQVKSNQKASVPFQQAWRSYCDAHGGGFYDPARHSAQFLEDFLKTAAKGTKSKAKKESESSESSSRSRARRRRRHGRRHTRGRRRRRERRDRRDRRGRRRKRSRSSSSALPSRATAIKGAERAVAAATKELEALSANAVDDEDAIQEEQRRKEVEKALEKVQSDAAAELQEKLREAEARLAEEKQTRLSEAEDKLKQAIVERLKDAEVKFRAEEQGRIEDARLKAKARVKALMDEVPTGIHGSRPSIWAGGAAQDRGLLGRADLGAGAACENCARGGGRPTVREGQEWQRMMA
ncbi:unnamed protein product [Effrenium voratum]|uniref:Uncharacterized protein n=1 Tax=Effrenium voratum TaxID=2562239 RepID=A0AA36N073_9DINO|nr:unnamed protein product [Effrenium voratum]CAJ1393365.1 unnamed protein product [Effrenium voratum]CAJ1424613.1 unnamed protein product [Effrenium voratum]